jgi:hypothetical protein
LGLATDVARPRSLPGRPKISSTRTANFCQLIRSFELRLTDRRRERAISRRLPALPPLSHLSALFAFSAVKTKPSQPQSSHRPQRKNSTKTSAGQLLLSLRTISSPSPPLGGIRCSDGLAIGRLHISIGVGVGIGIGIAAIQLIIARPLLGPLPCA